MKRKLEFFFYFDYNLRTPIALQQAAGGEKGGDGNLLLTQRSGSSVWLEHQPVTLGVAGSSPVRFVKKPSRLRWLFLHPQISASSQMFR